MSKAPLPKRAMLPGIGVVRILYYQGNSLFMVCDNKDVRRLVPRWRLTFLPD